MLNWLSRLLYAIVNFLSPRFLEAWSSYALNKTYAWVALYHEIDYRIHPEPLYWDEKCSNCGHEDHNGRCHEIFCACDNSDPEGYGDPDDKDDFVEDEW